MTMYSDTILANPQGGTLALDGSRIPTTGYMVGGLVSPLIVDGSGDAFSIEHFGEYLKDHTAVGYLGWWTDQEDGRLWIDGSDHFGSLADAERAGRARGEIAIYDLRHRGEIRL